MGTGLNQQVNGKFLAAEGNRYAKFNKVIIFVGLGNDITVIDFDAVDMGAFSG